MALSTATGLSITFLWHTAVVVMETYSEASEYVSITTTAVCHKSVILKPVAVDMCMLDTNETKLLPCFSLICMAEVQNP